MQEDEQRGEERAVAVCGICGGEMEETEEVFECFLCKRFFGVGSKAREGDGCLQCGRLVGRYPFIEQATDWLSLSHPWWHYCPDCRSEVRKAGVSTVKDIVRKLLEEGQITISVLESRGVPRSFAEFCLTD